MILAALPRQCLINTYASCPRSISSVIIVLVLGVRSSDPEDPSFVRHFGFSARPTIDAPGPTAEPSSNLLTFSSTTRTWDSAA